MCRFHTYHINYLYIFPLLLHVERPPIPNSNNLDRVDLQIADRRTSKRKSILIEEGLSLPREFHVNGMSGLQT